MNLHNRLASINWRFNYFSKFNPGAEAPWGSTVWTYPSYTMCSIVCGSLSTGVLHDFATIFYHITPDFARTYSQFERTRWKTILSSSARRTGEGVQGVRKRGCKLHPLHPLILFRNLYHYIGGDTAKSLENIEFSGLFLCLFALITLYFTLYSIAYPLTVHA